MKTNENKTHEKKTPTYVKVIASVLAGLMIFSVVATVLTVLVAHAHWLAFYKKRNVVRKNGVSFFIHFDSNKQN